MQRNYIYILCSAFILSGCGGPSQEDLFNHFQSNLQYKDCPALHTELEFAKRLKLSLIGNQNKELTPLNLLTTVGSLGSSSVANIRQEESRSKYIAEQDQKILLINNQIMKKECVL